MRYGSDEAEDEAGAEAEAGAQRCPLAVALRHAPDMTRNNFMGLFFD